MEYEEFERRASQVWDEIPETFRSGVDGLVVQQKSASHPSIPDIYTLGECLTESYPSDWGGPETMRSVLVLYYGSFRKLSERDPDFDWEYEIWETVTHELRHHLESLAAEDALEDVDYAMDENFKRFRGEPFDPTFYRYGEEIAPGTFAAERDVFIEVEYGGGEPVGSELEFDWQGDRYVVPVPEEPGDVAFLQVVEGPDRLFDRQEAGEGSFCIVLIRRRGWLEQLGSLLRRSPPKVVQAEVEAGSVG